MVLTHRMVNGIDVAELAGRLAMADVPEVRQQLKTIIDQSQGKLILDLAKVGFMDSSGLSVLISAYKAIRLKKGEIVLAAPTPPVQSLIELTRLQEIFEIFPDSATAIKRLS